MKLEDGPPMLGQAGLGMSAALIVPAEDEAAKSRSSRLQLHQAHPEDAKSNALTARRQERDQALSFKRLQARPDPSFNGSNDEERATFSPGDNARGPGKVFIADSSIGRRMPATFSVMNAAYSNPEPVDHPQSQLSAGAKTDPRLASDGKASVRRQALLDLQNEARAASPHLSSRELRSTQPFTVVENRGCASSEPVSSHITMSMGPDRFALSGQQQFPQGHDPAKRPLGQKPVVHQQTVFHQQPVSNYFPQTVNKPASALTHKPQNAHPPSESVHTQLPLGHPLNDPSLAEATTLPTPIQDQTAVAPQPHFSPAAKLLAAFEAWTAFRRARWTKDDTVKTPTTAEGRIIWSGVFDFWYVRPVTYRRRCRRPGGCVLKINDSSSCDKCIRPEW